MRIYISGPMTGLPDFNRSAFAEVEERLRVAGYQDIFNPASLNNPDDIPRISPLCRSEDEQLWRDFMRFDIRQLSACHKIVLLPGWRNSRGARIELFLALQLGMEVLDSHTLRPISLRSHLGFTEKE